ncbi:DUF389 domain-containing protein [Mongoliitalea daihaiensis]|uniref:DUF389 domain-containing protein n=1 Tax=Mongoliitalea daihaiensis TaxID=2782006 RepID=UPI001F1D71DB|nr:DUF389 domain-containing protein [Mongoliitalea daihaiensis]UJP64980.1 DUF389 domain-containing protein [Mongoliitalea daihaiensis]
MATGRIGLIYDDELVDKVNKDIVPFISNAQKPALFAYSELRNLDCSEIELLLVYLSDAQLHELIEDLIGNPVKLGFLPHPMMKEAKQGFGISSNLEETIRYLLADRESFQIDVLLANDKPILNQLVIGRTFSMLSGPGLETNWIQKLKRKVQNFIKTFQRVSLQKFSISWQEQKEDTITSKDIETVALGMIVVQHGKSSILSRRYIEDSYANDGLFHTLIHAPKSLIEILKFAGKGIFRTGKVQKLPAYVAHIKTDALTLRSDKPISYNLDNTLLTAKELQLEVKSNALHVIPGEYLQVNTVKDSQKIYKVNQLPTGELKRELLKGYLPLTNHATTEEFKWLFTALRENSKLSSSYLVLMALSTLIAAFGLFGNSSPVIIGAMILAPLMSPIISLAMGVLRQDSTLIRDSLFTIGMGLLVGYFFAILITWITPLKVPNSEILARIRPNLLDLGVAAASGVAGAYAHAKKEVAKTLAGVAIAVALVPPLAVSGIGLGWLDWQIFLGALLLLGTNLAGMVLAGALTFLILGFSPFHLAKKGLLISLVLVLLISTPLGFGFSRMVKETQLVQLLSGKELDKGKLRDVKIIQMEPIRLSVTLVSDAPLDLVELEEVKQEIEGLVGKEIELELTLAIRIKNTQQ